MAQLIHSTRGNLGFWHASLTRAWQHLPISAAEKAIEPVMKAPRRSDFSYHSTEATPLTGGDAKIGRHLNMQPPGCWHSSSHGCSQ
jgi:hypothetical protein